LSGIAANCALAPPCKKYTLYESGISSSFLKSASASSMILVNSAERWLISMTDAPHHLKLSMSAAASSSTARGRTAGPAEKLKTRSWGWAEEGAMAAGCARAEVGLAGRDP
jgi:hypothetical protein